MRILVCGGRNLDEWAVSSYLSTLLQHVVVKEVIHGGAKGVDRGAEKFANFYSIKSTVFCADWDRYKQAAGPIRNQEMLDKSKPDIVIAFSGGTGTADMVKRAVKAYIPVLTIPDGWNGSVLPF